MKTITINLPEKYVNAIQILKQNKIVPSRSESIRIALKEFLLDDVELYQDLESENTKKILNSNSKTKANPKKRKQKNQSNQRSIYQKKALESNSNKSTNKKTSFRPNRKRQVYEKYINEP